MLPDVIKGYIDARIIRSLGKGGSRCFSERASSIRDALSMRLADRCAGIKGYNCHPNYGRALRRLARSLSIAARAP